MVLVGRNCFLWVSSINLKRLTLSTHYSTARLQMSPAIGLKIGAQVRQWK